jgi:hypothetical protein
MHESRAKIQTRGGDVLRLVAINDEPGEKILGRNGAGESDNDKTNKRRF